MVGNALGQIFMHSVVNIFGVLLRSKNERTGSFSLEAMLSG